MDILMNLESRTFVVLLVIALVLSVVAWKVVEGFDGGVVAPLSDTVDIAEHLGGNTNVVNHGPRLVAALSNADTGTQILNPYCNQNNNEEEVNCEGSELEEAWNPLV